MDLNGIPKKINRHVLKALITVLGSGLRFTEVLQYVRLCNKKLKPVPNIKHVVLKSLENFQRIGLIKRDNKYRYKITNLVVPSSVPSGRVKKRMSVEATKQSFLLDPNSRRRTNVSIEEDTVESTRKRFRSQKNISNREGRKVNLPNIRRKNIAALNFPTDGQLFADNMVTAPNLEEDAIMGAVDEKDNEYDDDEILKALSEEKGKESDEITAPAPDNTSESVTENQKNNENSGETSTAVASAGENFDRLQFNYRSYLN